VADGPVEDGRFGWRRKLVNRVVLVHPLLSSTPTGMGVAASGLSALLLPDLAADAEGLNRWFRWVNDSVFPGPLRLLLRLLLAQLTPFFERSGSLLVFSSHHAPLWPTGRHVVIIYDLIALHHPGQARMQNLFFRFVLPRVLRSATRIVTISGAVRDQLILTHPFLRDRKIDVIPACSETAATPTGTGEGTAVQRRNVLVVGARYPHKNLGLVLDAMALMTDRGSDERLVLAGVRPELWRDRASWRRLDSAGLLEILEFPSDNEVNNLYLKARCLVYPSLEEGQGLPPLEAFARGCPVVCSDIPVLRETCGSAAFFLDKEDPLALASLLSDLCRGEMAGELEEKRRAAVAVIGRFSAATLRDRWRGFLAPMT